MYLKKCGYWENRLPPKLLSITPWWAPETPVVIVDQLVPLCP